jgi:hypothetical protein
MKAVNSFIMDIPDFGVGSSVSARFSASTPLLSASGTTPLKNETELPVTRSTSAYFKNRRAAVSRQLLYKKAYN